MAVAGYLLLKQKIGTTEQSQSFIRGLLDKLWQQILTQLQVIKPEHDLDDKWAFANVVKVARYVLHGTVTWQSPSASDSTLSMVTIKKEEFTAMMEGLGKTITLALMTSLGTQSACIRNSNMASASQLALATPPPFLCYYCQGPHGVVRCEKVVEDMQAGIVKRNKENWLVLAYGSAIPLTQEIPGNSPCKQARAWHQANPLMVVGLFMIPDLAVTLQVSMDNQLKQLKQEIFQL